MALNQDAILKEYFCKISLMLVVQGSSAFLLSPLLFEVSVLFGILVIGQKEGIGDTAGVFKTGMCRPLGRNHAALRPGSKLSSRLWPTKHS